jgi:hypothetical protein
MQEDSRPLATRMADLRHRSPSGCSNSSHTDPNPDGQGAFGNMLWYICVLRCSLTVIPARSRHRLGSRFVSAPNKSTRFWFATTAIQAEPYLWRLQWFLSRLQGMLVSISLARPPASRSDAIGLAAPRATAVDRTYTSISQPSTSGADCRAQNVALNSDEQMISDHTKDASMRSKDATYATPRATMSQDLSAEGLSQPALI